ncbi:hypothetical protein [Castellaniella sp.]|uniref:hypothetical protein n=1 Tax=Castellaniella sp. TaxID=1955812 RepID=UPI002AFEAC07|nr:hypothetical protein [Castellaniella sp.]
MQKFSVVEPTTKVSDSLTALMDNDKTALSNNSGSAFPTTNLVVGMQCWRDDEGVMYVLKSVSPVIWEPTTSAPKADEGGTPTGLAIKANSYGDVEFSWSATGDISGRVFRVDVLTTGPQPSVIRTIRVTGQSFVDYPVELSVVDFGFPPGYLKFRVREESPTAYWAGAYAITDGNTVVSDSELVKLCVVFAGQSNVGAHFNTLSGATKATQSATTFRAMLAKQRGLRAIEVLPINLSVGASTADKAAQIDMATYPDYWYDLESDVAGPSLNAWLSGVLTLGIPVDVIVWGQGESDINGIAFPGSANPVPSIGRTRAAWLKIFAKMRSVTKANIRIVIQGLHHGFYGDPPQAIGKQVGDALFEVQREIASDQNTTLIKPPATLAADWLAEGLNYSHYKPDAYHRAARSLVSNIVRDLDTAGVATGVTAIDTERVSDFTAETGGTYWLRSSIVVILPAVAGLEIGASVTLSKSLSATPTIQVGVGAATIRTAKGSDTSVIFDVDAELTFVFNGTDWEV